MQYLEINNLSLGVGKDENWVKTRVKLTCTEKKR